MRVEMSEYQEHFYLHDPCVAIRNKNVPFIVNLHFVLKEKTDINFPEKL